MSEGTLNYVEIVLCNLCLNGKGGECHVPGCALWMSTAPDVPIREKAERIDVLDLAWQGPQR